ncbi:MAG: acyl carrier protein [Elusimicrobia bacterium RIFOXYB2_FULL_49_7]|nr:MAG: acyl carrier protein [Elusimicrobia bacterium RIFOXYB2_FULL_49_7]
MTIQEVEQKVKEITAKVLKKNPAQIQANMRFVEDLGADSLKSLELVAAYDEGFEIEMDEDQALDVKNVGDAIRFIEKYVSK